MPNGAQDWKKMRKNAEKGKTLEKGTRKCFGNEKCESAM